MPPPVAALDADVLVPIIVCDFLLTAFDHGLYEPVVSATALDEVERALSADFPNLTADAVRYRVDAMRDALADHVIDADPSDAPDAINAKDRTWSPRRWWVGPQSWCRTTTHSVNRSTAPRWHCERSPLTTSASSCGSNQPTESTKLSAHS
jgi:hypothetical protein